jgi:hypothetical protein
MTTAAGAVAAETTEMGEYQPEDRDRALRRVAAWTIGGVSGAERAVSECPRVALQLARPSDLER